MSATAPPSRPPTLSILYDWPLNLTVPGERIDGGARVGMGIEAAATLYRCVSTGAAAGRGRTSRARSPCDSSGTHCARSELELARQLPRRAAAGWGGAFEVAFTAFGHDVAGNVSETADSARRKARAGQFLVAQCYRISNSVLAAITYPRLACVPGAPSLRVAANVFAWEIGRNPKCRRRFTTCCWRLPAVIVMSAEDMVGADYWTSAPPVPRARRPNRLSISCNKSAARNGFASTPSAPSPFAKPR
jgi:hypothetical protein